MHGCPTVNNHQASKEINIANRTLHVTIKNPNWWEDDQLAILVTTLSRSWTPDYQEPPD